MLYNKKKFLDYLSCSIVDNSCKDDEKLKFVVFSSPDETKTIASECEIGDIVRFHRVKVSFNFINPLFLILFTIYK